MIDLTSIIIIIIVIAVICLFIKFIVSPVIRIALGIIIFLIFIYFLQQFFGFDINKILAPFGIFINFNKFASSFNWLLTPINHFLDQLKNFWDFIWHNVPKS